MNSLNAGYSGTPLAKKLGIKPGGKVTLINPPSEYLQWLHPIPDGVVFASTVGTDVAVVHLFTVDRNELSGWLEQLRSEINPDATVWVSWPKKASRVPTTVSEETIRELGLPIGFVDVKVCAVSDIWSGLKLVVRKELRVALPQG